MGARELEGAGWVGWVQEEGGGQDREERSNGKDVSMRGLYQG